MESGRVLISVDLRRKNRGTSERNFSGKVRRLGSVLRSILRFVHRSLDSDHADAETVMKEANVVIIGIARSREPARSIDREAKENIAMLEFA